MTNEHKLVCKAMNLVYFKPNEIIVRQGDPGDSFFYILWGIVKIVVSKNFDLGIEGEGNLTMEKYLGDLKAGQTFGELSLIYGTPRSATIISVTNSTMIKLDKISFDSYVKDIFDNQLKDQIDFMKICPLFHKISKDTLIKLGITTERKRLNSGQAITKLKDKSSWIYIVRRGTVKAIKPIDFIKDENSVKKQLNNIRKLGIISYEDIKVIKEINSEKLIDKLSVGPSEEDYKIKNYVTKNITLETLKMGDIFPSFHCVNNLPLDVFYEAESPCDLIAIKISDIQNTTPDAYKFIQMFAKPYPNDDFLRKFFYYNNIWMNFKSTIKHNIIADTKNKNLINKNSMRQKLINRKNLDSIKLPSIFNNKNSHLNE